MDSCNTSGLNVQLVALKDGVDSDSDLQCEELHVILKRCNEKARNFGWGDVCSEDSL
jgi:hypothetical protein